MNIILKLLMLAGVGIASLFASEFITKKATDNLPAGTPARKYSIMGIQGLVVSLVVGLGAVLLKVSPQSVVKKVTK